MRLNKYIALHTDYSRRNADELVNLNRVLVNGLAPQNGQDITDADEVTIDDRKISPQTNITTIKFNKPIGYVCSRDGQGSKTIYQLLPVYLQHLNSVGRLDKDSSGLLIMTNDGELANQLTHPRYQKTKIYQVTLNKPLTPLHQQMISDIGITLSDGVSKLQIHKLTDTGTELQITMQEGRNRQIRRTFLALDYSVQSLHRTVFGADTLNDLGPGEYVEVG